MERKRGVSAVVQVLISVTNFGDSAFLYAVNFDDSALLNAGESRHLANHQYQTGVQKIC